MQGVSRLAALVSWAVTMLRGEAAVLVLDIHYPESGLNAEAVDALDGNIFSVGYSALPYSTELVSQYADLGSQYYPWFGNYTIFVNNRTHRQGPDHWRTNISLNDTFSGNLYIDLSMNFYGFGETQTVYACNAQFSMGTCQPRHSPWQVYIPPSLAPAEIAADGEISLVMHPAFSATGLGKTFTLFKNYYSESLDNYRDISVYMPWSLLENPISRERAINAIVLLDGDLSTTSLFTTQGGIDAAVLSGGLPELLVIGVPPALNGSACKDSDGEEGGQQCSQRFYELTPTPCDSSVSECDQQQPSGGADLFLRLVWDEVVPAVFAQLDLGPSSRAEVSIVGYSLGGLTACYAASAMPTLFQRAFCMSPSLWWNSGDLAKIIASNFEATGSKPVSITMAVGTQEAPSIMTMNLDQQPWTQYIEATVSAWQAIGLGEEVPSTSTSGSTSTTSSLFYYTTTGGIHNIISWVDTIVYGLSLLFQTEFPAPYPQSSSRTTWQYPPKQIDYASSPGSDDSIMNDRIKTLLLVVMTVLCLAMLPANMYHFSKTKCIQRKKFDIVPPDEMYRLIESREKGQDE